MRLDKAVRRLSPHEKRFTQWAYNKHGDGCRWTWWFMGNLNVMYALFLIEKTLTRPDLNRVGRETGKMLRWKIRETLGAVDRDAKRAILDTIAPRVPKGPRAKRKDPWWKRR